MGQRTRIFICYKKRDSEGRENNSAYQLYQFLNEEPAYQVWMDEGLDAGLLWEKTIYEQVLSSDVVILAVGDGTSQSEWVRRELSLAMACEIQIVPVGLDIAEAQMHQELQALNLGHIHYRRPFNIASQTARAIVKELAPAIERARMNTRLGGYELVKKIHENVQPKHLPARPARPSAASRTFQIGDRDITLHIAAGDIFRLSNYDLIVNSENDYMQMARIFDSASLSASIRHLGSAIDKGYLEDTIQLEIERKVAGRFRPVPPSTAIVTSSGGPSSSLYVNNRVTHVIHIAAVQAVLAEHRIVPLKGETHIRNCVISALSAIQELCSAGGVVSPEDTAQRALQEQTADRFAPTSVVLPLFGTGRGGESAAEVGPIILEGILEFFSSPLFWEDYMPVRDFHISAFTEDDLATLSGILAKLAQP